MNPRFILVAVLVAASLTACSDSVPLSYPTRAAAEAEPLFARGWLPEIIPPSSRNITMRNDLDLNTSDGEFRFDASDHDPFVRQLERASSEDQAGFSAYHYADWTFWIHHERNRCKYRFRMNRIAASHHHVR